MLTKLFLTIILLLSLHIKVIKSLEPLSKEEHLKRIEKMNQQVEPFRKNLTECAHQTKSSSKDIDNFLAKLPQETVQGKCLVACILRRTDVIVKNVISPENLIASNIEVYGENSEVVFRLKTAINECLRVVANVFEICEYASMFNDCMHIKMEHMLNKATLERRLEMLGQMAEEPDSWSDDDDVLKLLKDEL